MLHRLVPSIVFVPHKLLAQIIVWELMVANIACLVLYELSFNISLDIPQCTIWL